MEPSASQPPATVNLFHRLPVLLTLHRQRVGGNLSLIFKELWKEQLQSTARNISVKFNMSTLIAFEQTSDKSFFGENFDKLYSRVILVFAAMFAADEKITTEVLLNSNDWQGITKAFNTIMEMAAEFFKVPKIVSDAEAKETTTDKQEKPEKN